MTNKPYILLVAVDFSEQADRALHEAFAQASQRATSEVHVLSALPLSGEDPGGMISAYAPLNETPLLATALKRLKAHVEQELQKFSLAHASGQLAAHLEADLIVMGTRNKKGLERLLLGSVAEGAVRNARCPVLVIPAPPEPQPEL